MAIAIATFGFLLTTHIFAPTYIRHANDELHDILLDQAESDSTKESLCRALLLSTFDDDDREVAVAGAISTTAKEADDLLGPLLASEARGAFRSEFDVLTREAARLWHRAQHTTVRVEASLKGIDTGNWRDLALPSGEHNSPVAGAAAATDLSHDEAMQAIFPSIFKVDEDGWEAVFPGILLRNAQIAAAEREWRHDMSKLGRGQSARLGQSKRNRRASGANGHSGIIRSPTHQSFLGQMRSDG